MDVAGEVLLCTEGGDADADADAEACCSTPGGAGIGGSDVIME